MVSLSLIECSKTAPKPEETDAGIFAKSVTKEGFTYYKSDSTIHRSSPQSAHSGFFRVRFNLIAYAALTDNGKLPAGGSFPVHSLVVKELHDDSTGNNPHGYAIMEKLPDDTSAAGGWVWAEYGLTGTGYTINNKGAICTSCHSTNSRDKVRVFDLFP
ncbi:MAG: hypothetical protein JWO03_2905 [Bacteroidetes bacterium]|nr:hypothetical protein [Bacteroidota bacterium]